MNKINYKDFIIEKLSADNLKDVQYLFQVAFQVRVSEESIRNKHLFCHGSNKYIGYLAYHADSGEPAAHYAVYPGYLRFNNKQVLVAQSGDTMTNPKFQKQGLFVRLAEITFDYCEKAGIEMITGLPNINSYNGFIRNLNFQEYPRFINLCFLQNKFEIHRFTKRSEFATKIHQAYARLVFSAFLKRATWFENSNQHEPSLAFMVHEKDFYSLKKNPNNLFLRIKKVNIWLRIENNDIVISDIDIAEQQTRKLKSILSLLRLLTFIAGIRFLNFSSTRNAYLHTKLKGFSTAQSEGYTFIIKNLGSKIPLEKISLLACDADVF